MADAPPRHLPVPRPTPGRPAGSPVPKPVKTKKRCCMSTPRCTTCPVVWKRLAVAGLAERLGKRRWRLTAGKVPKPVMKVMRRS